jgi:hypothetical protein
VTLAVATASTQQKDDLCGPFWAARVLRDAGIETWDGEDLDDDLVALRAGTLLPEPPLGWDGRHLQPPRAVAAALLRGDGREGGALAAARPERAEGIETLSLGLGLELGIWDNGTRA